MGNLYWNQRCTACGPQRAEYFVIESCSILAHHVWSFRSKSDGWNRIPNSEIVYDTGKGHENHRGNDIGARSSPDTSGAPKSIFSSKIQDSALRKCPVGAIKHTFCIKKLNQNFWNHTNFGFYNTCLNIFKYKTYQKDILTIMPHSDKNISEHRR